MRRGRAFPGAFVSTLRIQNAARSRSEKSVLLASAQGNLDFQAVARYMGRLFGSYVGAASPDFLAAAAADVSSDDGADFEAGAAHRKAKKESEK